MGQALGPLLGPQAKATSPTEPRLEGPLHIGNVSRIIKNIKKNLGENPRNIVEILSGSPSVGPFYQIIIIGVSTCFSEIGTRELEA